MVSPVFLYFVGDLKDEGAHVVVEVKQSRPVDIQDRVERMPTPEQRKDENKNIICRRNEDIKVCVVNSQG